METVDTALRESTSSSGGAPEKNSAENQNSQDQSSSTEGKAGSVSYDTHRKLLAEKKKAEERIAAFEAEKRQREESELRAKEDYKKMVELRDAELKAIRAEHESLKTQVNEQVKMRAFLDGVPGNVERQYWSLIDLEKIAVDPETRQIDPVSVQMAVRDFQAKYPDVIRPKNVKLPPNEAAKGGSGKLTRDEWLRLPADEMKKRLKDVVSN